MFKNSVMQMRYFGSGLIGSNNYLLHLIRETLVLMQKISFNLRLMIILLLAWCPSAWSQDGAGFFSIGYQYAYFGSSLAPAQIRMFDDNTKVPAGGNRFTNYQHGYGLVLRATLPSEGKFQMELTAANKKVVSDQAYNLANADSSVLTPVDVKVKSRIRSFSFGGSYYMGNFSVGGSVDLGVFASMRRFSGEGITHNKKWEPWFYTQKVLGSGVTGKTPVIGFTVFASYRFARLLQLRVYKQFTGFGMGAELSDNYFSISNIGAELAFTFPK